MEVLDPNLTAYLRQADATYRNGFESDEMKELFLDSVFEEIKGNELKLSFMTSFSFVMEQFICSASPQNILQLLKIYSRKFQEISESKQGCHVIESTLRRFVELLHLSETISEFPAEELFNEIESCCEVFSDPTQAIQAMHHVYHTYTIRSLLRLLGGVLPPVTKNGINPGATTVLPNHILPQRFVQTFDKAVTSFRNLDNQKIIELLSNPSGSPCVICMIDVAAARSWKSLGIVCKRILASCEKKENNWNTLIILAKDKTSSHVIESMINGGHQATCIKLQEIFCSSQDTLLDLACHPTTNFVIQRLISSPVLTEQFEKTLDSLVFGLEDILAERRFGVIQKLAEKCVEVKCCQKKFIGNLLKAFHCEEEEKRKYVVSLIASFTTYDMMFPDETKPAVTSPLQAVVYHGSLLLQTLLKYDNPSVIVNSFTEIPLEHCVRIACDASGSRLIDEFFSSSRVTKKKKLLFLESLKEKLFTIACDKYGSRVLEHIWKVATINMKTFIAEKLANHGKELLLSQFGKHVYRNIDLRQFSARKDVWKTAQLSKESKRKMFDNLLPAGNAKRVK